MNFPYVYQYYSVRKIMFFVLIACIPGICAKCYFFGVSVLMQIFFSIVIALLFEICILKIRCKNIKINLYDNSAIVTAVLFSVSLPSFLPWWVIVIGLFFAIVVSKHLYGGLGQNIFNPAMVGYAVLLISFPLYMSNWMENNSSFLSLIEIKKYFHLMFSTNSIYDYTVEKMPDFFSQATPLDNFKTYLHSNHNSVVLKNSVLSNNIEVGIQKSWVWINISFMFGGLFLIYKKIICWRIPLTFLFILFFFSVITYGIYHCFFASPIVHLFSGGTMICAFFIATDPVTTACTNLGKIIFGIVMGFLVWSIRNYSDYPDAIVFAVLFSNMIVPLIDHFFQSSGYGHKNI